MSEFTDFLGKIRRLSAEELVNLGHDALNKTIDGLKKAGFNDEQISAAVMNLTKLFISADQRFTEEEYSYWKAITGVDISAQDLFEATNGGKEVEFVKSGVAFVKSLDEETRTAAIMFGIAVLACDRSFDIEECELIQKLMAE